MVGFMLSMSFAKDITVGASGSDFTTIQQAVVEAPLGAHERTIIHIKPGTYQGPLIVPQGKAITLSGENAATTIITYDKNVFQPAPKGSDQFNPSVQIKGNNFRAENITFQNAAGDHGQALALKDDGDRSVYQNCRILGWQDTLMVNNGRHYFKDCYIEGRVDFIYGSGVAVFDKCEIHSKNGGFVTAANTPQDKPFGFVFLNCKLTGDAIPWNPATTNPSTTDKPGSSSKGADLGRPWRPYASVAFIHCAIGDHISPQGWNDWGNKENHNTARFVEFGNTGPGANTAKRVPWAKQLTKTEADAITLESVLKGTDNWDPTSNADQAPPVTAGPMVAETAEILGDNARLEDGNNIGFWTNTDTKIEWRTLVQPGTFKVELTYALDGAQGGGEIEVAIGKEKIRFTPSATKGWSDYKTTAVGTVKIKDAGSISVILTALSKKGGFILNVSKIALVRAKD